MRGVHYVPSWKQVHTGKNISLVSCSHFQSHHPLLISRRFIGPRQYLPQGIRESTSRVPMTFEMG